MIVWEMLHPRATLAHLGLLAYFLSEANPACATKQLGDKYQSGWVPQKGFDLADNDLLLYPGDPPLRPFAKTKLRDETVYVYESSFVAVIQPDRSFEVCRMD